MFALALLATLQFHYDASEFVNAVYHVSCLTGRIACSNAVYTRFWNDVMHATPQDGARFDTWSQIFDRVERAAPKPQAAPLMPNYVGFYPGLRLRQTLLAAAFEAGSPEAFQTLAEPVAGAEDAKALGQVLKHTLERLHPWYTRNTTLAAERLKLVETRMRQDGAQRLIDGVSAFVRASFPHRDVWVHALPSPAPEQTDATATATRNHVTIEITRSMEPEGAASIVLHEVTHALYDSAPQENHRNLIAQFIAAKHPATPALYGLLNEAFATGIQLLAGKQEPVDDKDVYRHPYIPRLGRSTAPVLKRALADHKTILQGFVRAYMSAAELELGGEIATSRFQLVVAGILASDKNKRARDAFLETFRTVASASEEEELNNYATMNAVRLFTYDEQRLKAAGIPELDVLLKRRGFAYRMPAGSTQRQTWILAGQNPDTVGDVVKQLAKESGPAKAGLLFMLD